MGSQIDQRFHEIACSVARSSRCMSRQIGAIIVKDNIVVSTGYNSPPITLPDCRLRTKFDSVISHESRQRQMPLPEEFSCCPRRFFGHRSGEGLYLCPAIHAEADAIANAARHGVRTAGCSMYVTCGIPCKSCLGLIINSGIQEVVCANLKHYDVLTSYITRPSELHIRTYDIDNSSDEGGK